MTVTVSWLITLLVICEGRHRDADRMLSNVRSTLNDRDSTSWCQLRSPKCMVHSEKSRPLLPRPFNGVPALLREFPHTGAIGWTQKDGRILWHCGGTLIWPDYVLTAAHCVVDSTNAPPDIVRFGDLNLETDDDEQDEGYSQQLKIVQMFRYPLHRFGSKYHDIGLMKLEGSVRLTSTVCPACLWLDKEIRFNEFVATGWGRTSHLGNKTPFLLKVSLKPKEISKCEPFFPSGIIRGLSSGLHENHLCAFNEIMDTCEGDSGGPLEVKMIHHVNLTPFIVAITSFGLPCGGSKPGIYTKVAPYHDWIVATMRQSGATVEDDIFNATFCALRFQKYHDTIFSVDSPLNEPHVEVLRFSYRHIAALEPPSYLVKLMWNAAEEPRKQCYGILIDEDTVLTIANCVHHQGNPASSVSHPVEGTINISKINVHPMYNATFGYYNIAILRLKKLYSFMNIRPACIDYGNFSKRVPDTVFGVGRKDIYNCFLGYPHCADPSPTPLTVFTQPKNESNCVIPHEFKPRFPNGLTDELICSGIDRFTLPGVCELKLGGSLSARSMETTSLQTLDGITTMEGDMFPPLDALVQVGRDCGYGEHLVGTNVRSHVEWMERVLLPQSVTIDGVHFLDPNRHMGDSCTNEYGLSGVCTSIFRCQRKWKEFKLTKETIFCSSTSIICCLREKIDKDAWSDKHSLLAKCPDLVNALVPIDNSAPLVRILNSLKTYICMGAIISDRTIITSASCIESETNLYVQHSRSIEPIAQVQEILPHNSYNKTDYTNDIALLRISQALTWSQNLHPICFWINDTHSPLIVEMLQPFDTNDTDLKFLEVLTMYNSDCQRSHAHRLRNSHICVKYPYRNYTCLSSHSLLRWEDSERVPYLIGLGTDTRECLDWYYMVYARVATFLDWVVDHVDKEEMERSFGEQIFDGIMTLEPTETAMNDSGLSTSLLV